MDVQTDIPRTYPHGVPCWVDAEQPDLDRAVAFYGSLFGWSFVDAMPPGAPGHYLIASLDGLDVAALSPSPGGAAWNTYVACTDADASAADVGAAGGTVVTEPYDAGPGGRTATCADPQGAVFRLWQPRRRLGAQLVNVPGTWNFSDLHTPDPGVLTFYAEVFGWQADLAGAAGMVRVPGYGDHLAATVDPHIRERQAGAPPGFADVAAGVSITDGSPGWQVRFAVADRDAVLAVAERLGAGVVSTAVTAWTRQAVVLDPQGARFTVSQYTPPAPPG